MMILTGTARLGRDPELRDANNSQVCELSVAWNTGYNDKRVTTWALAEIWGRTAEIAAEKLRKGALVLLTGEVSQEEYKDREGAKKQRFKIRVSSWEALERGDASDGGQQAPPQRPPPPQRQPPRPQPPRSQPSHDDDIPF